MAKTRKKYVRSKVGGSVPGPEVTVSEPTPKRIRVVTSAPLGEVQQPVGGLRPQPFHKPIQSGSFRPFGGRR